MPPSLDCRAVRHARGLERGADLQRCWDRADILDALAVGNLAHVVETERDLAPGDERLAVVMAGHDLELRLDASRISHRRQQLLDLLAAGVGKYRAVHDRRRRHQRLFECVGGRDIGRRRAFAHRYSDPDAGETHPAFRIDDALLVELIHGRLGHDHDVVHVVRLDLLHHGGGRTEGKNDVMVGFAVKLLGERL